MVDHVQKLIRKTIPKFELKGVIDYNKAKLFNNCARAPGDVRNNPFTPKNQLARAENMSGESNSRRMLALMRGWETNRRKAEGENILGQREKYGKLNIRRKRDRLRLQTTVAKEAREIQEMCRTHAETAIRTMAELIESPAAQDSVKVAAAQLILDRAYGKSSQTNINATIDANGKADNVSEVELNTRIKKALDRVESLTAGAPAKVERKEQPADLRKLN